MTKSALTSRMLFACVLLLAPSVRGQTVTITPTTDVLGVHDLSAGSSPLHGPNANACIYCHAPHSGASKSRLWNQTLSTQQYTLYPGTTQNPTTQSSVGEASRRCLSCHDGSVAVGQTISMGTLKMAGALTENMGTKLQGSHPISIQPKIKDAPSLVSTLAASHVTKDSAVQLFDNNVECSTCHDVHNQYKDRRSKEFLVRDNTASRLCFACHDIGARNVAGRENTLVAWPASAHAKSMVALTPQSNLGGYSLVSEFGCSACHASHGALGAGLLRTNPNRPVNVDDTSQVCFSCHDGSDNLATPIRNILAAFQSPGQTAHPFADTSNPHTVDEPVILDRNRHTTCADCHASHGAQPTTTFSGNPEIRPSQAGVLGVSSEGTITKAVYQYENCLRCHSTSGGKESLPTYGYMPARALFAGDTLDVSLQFSHGAPSSHPVMRDAINLSRLSLLKYMWNVGFKVQGRAIGSRILCTDCHNNDNNREFGGTGPNGPHGSRNDHILERQYTISKVGPGAAPGSAIVNLTPTPVLEPISAAPYALCAKCHDLSFINSGASWTEHTRHMQDGFSCSVCHSSHGVPAGTSGVNGGRALVSFDLNVVGPNNNQPISYNSASSCTLTCHGHPHQ